MSDSVKAGDRAALMGSRDRWIRSLCTVAIVADVVWLFTGMVVTALFYPRVAHLYSGLQRLQLLDGFLYRFAVGLPVLHLMMWGRRTFKNGRVVPGSSRLGATISA